MKFKRIEVYGFKSFADKHEIPFGQGVTAIVGPNGCGKSNVADSIRWVLGEQSAKLLRGSSMQDVIFNGTEKRKSMSYCEVSLVFDNTDKQLFPSLEYEEVVISRKLFRSGESEYLINRTPCRLKDITELLRDGGMGREGYSIIGQGRIDELLSAKPEDRRQIFEEAAGISKYKAKKTESERKLLRTRDNLTRITDILAEKSRQLEPLNKQAEAAKKWLDMRDKLKNHEINIYMYQYETASDAKKVIGTRLDGINEAIASKSKSYEDTNAAYNEAMYNMNSLDKNIEILREELLTLTVNVEKQAGDIKVLNERLCNFKEDGERLKRENCSLDVETRQALEKAESIKTKLDARREELLNARQNADRLKEKYIEISEKLTSGETAAETSQRQLMEAMDKLSEIKANMSKLTAEKQALSSVVDDITKRMAALSEASKALVSQTEIEKESYKAETKRKDDSEEKLKDFYGENNDLLLKIKQSGEGIDSLNQKYYTASSRLKMLAEMQAAYEGYAYSIKNLMRDAANEKRLSDRMEGVIAQLISVDEKFETAIETALGGAMQNIVTRNEDDAKYLIEYLKAKRYGRVTFLPISSVKPRYVDNVYAPMLRRAGCYGIADKLIKFDKKYETVISGLLGGTVIVEDMDTAIALARASRSAFKIVTLEGEVLNTQGAITGGSKKSDIANIFSHDREKAELESTAETLSKELNKMTSVRAEYMQRLETVQAEIKRLQGESHAAEVGSAAIGERIKKLLDAIDENKLSYETLKADLDRDSARVAEIDADINSVGELENVILTKKAEVTLTGSEHKEEYNGLKKRRDSIQEEMTNARLTAANLESDVKALEYEADRLAAEIESNAAKIENNNVQIENCKISAEGIEKNIRQASVSSDAEDGVRIKEIREKLGSLDRYKAELMEKVSESDKTRTELMSELQTYKDKKSREEMLLLKVDTDIEQMETRVREEYGMEYADCLAFKEEGYDVSAGSQEASRLKRAMSALGNVNVDAIEMSEIIGKDFNELDAQRQDLEKAEADLLKIIKELSGEMYTRFTEKFEQIRVNFVKIFKELFNGGTADLLLLESEDPLEAGIEIVAQPPEKKLQSITLLSGGEKALTAIAILFAILKLRPMPFCLLDEIEAALDDANANRFAKYLRRFSEETQFIVITHRKPTMELADNLYGVTMEEKGVSKIVSVKLSEAVESVARSA